MTPENQKLRDALKAAENIIVSALAHQPEDSNECRKHLQKACKKVDISIRRAIGMPVAEEVFCSECGKKLDKVVLHMFGREDGYDATVDFTSALMDDGSLGICICTDTNWCCYDQCEEDIAQDIRCPPLRQVSVCQQAHRDGRTQSGNHRVLDNADYLQGTDYHESLRKQIV